MRQLSDSDFDVIDLRPSPNYLNPPAKPYPQYTELLCGLLVVCLLVGSVSYLTAFSYQFIAQQQLERMK